MMIEKRPLITFIFFILLLSTLFPSELFSEDIKKIEIREDARQLFLRAVDYLQSTKDHDAEKEKEFLNEQMRGRKSKISKESLPPTAAGSSISKINLNWFSFASLKISKDGKYGFVKFFINFMLPGVPKPLDQLDRTLWGFDEKLRNWFVIEWDNEIIYKFDEEVPRDFDPKGIQKFEYSEYTVDMFSDDFLKKAEASMKLGKIKEAEDLYTKAAKSNGLGIWDKLPLKDENFLQKIMPVIYPKEYNFCLILGQAFEKNELLDHAVDAYKKAQGIDKSDVTSYENLSNVLFKKKEFQKAINELKEALNYVNLFDIQLRLYTRMGYFYSIMGNYVEAKKYLTLAFLSDPIGGYRSLPYKFLGDVYFNEGKYEDALKAYKTCKRLIKPEEGLLNSDEIEKLIEDSLSKGSNWKELSDFYYKKLSSKKGDKGFLSEFISINEKAEKKNPEMSSALNYRQGECYFLLEDYKKSESYFSKVLKEVPNSLGANLMLRAIGIKSNNMDMRNIHEGEIRSLYPKIPMSSIPENLIDIGEDVDLSRPGHEGSRGIVVSGKETEENRRDFFLKVPESGNYLLKLIPERFVLMAPQKARIFMDLYIDNQFINRYLLDEGVQELFSLTELDAGHHCIILEFSSDNINLVKSSPVVILFHKLSFISFDGKIMKGNDLALFTPPVSIILRSGNFDYENMGDIIIEGKNISPKKRGYNFAALSFEDGIVFDVDYFDFFKDEAAPDNLIKKINSLPEDTIICLCSQDEAS
ncbi:hypothetical protein KKB18_09780, partial [bacterium]|nr:hypothetical protein [bacterium]